MMMMMMTTTTTTTTDFNPEDGGSMFLQNVGIYLKVHMVFEGTRPTKSSPLP
jgi:hypothetical protein